MVWAVRIAIVLLLAALIIRLEFGSIPEGDPRFRVAAEDGDAFAQAQLGQHYLISSKTDEDEELALYWLERAASQDEPMALYLLGVLREQGRNFQEDLHAALPFYLRAARLNNGPAQDHLAHLFATGALGRPNYMESYKWHLLAVRHGGDIGETDYGVGQKLSEAQKQMALQAADRIAAGFTADGDPAS